MAPIAELHPIQKIWLMPGESVPCSVYFYFRGKYVKGMSASEPISIDLLAKLSKVKYSTAYIKEEDLPIFNEWKTSRHPHLQQELDNNEANSKANGKDRKNGGNEQRTSFISYAQKQLALRNASDEKLVRAVSDTARVFRKVVEDPLLDWFFKNGYENLEILQHNARVSYMTALFCISHELLDIQETENLVFSAIIHELKGDPKTSIGQGVSQQTIEYLEKKQHAVPAAVMELLHNHDELANGKGLPNQKESHEVMIANKIFSICNHFDHYRLNHFGNTRRDRLKKTITAMEEKSEMFDSFIFEEFVKFMYEEFDLTT